jgi:hypothetical protein
MYLEQSISNKEKENWKSTGIEAPLKLMEG